MRTITAEPKTMNKIEQADGRRRQSAFHKYLKKAKARWERRRAKKKPDCQPGYNKYSGYET